MQEDSEKGRNGLLSSCSSEHAECMSLTPLKVFRHLFVSFCHLLNVTADVSCIQLKQTKKKISQVIDFLSQIFYSELI